MYPEEVYILPLPYELNEMIARELAKMLILEKLEFPKIVPYYYSSGKIKRLKGRDYEFSYNSDDDEYYYIIETSTIRWKVDESNNTKRYNINQNPFIE